MKINLRNLQTFIEVVHSGSFFKAAQSLGYAQATVSQQIQTLERELSSSLFERNGKRIVLSAAGKALYAQAVDLVDRAKAVEASIRDFGVGDAGVLRIGASEPTASQLVIPLFKAFCASRPNLRILFEVGGADTQGILVASGKVDVAVSAEPPSSLGLAFEEMYNEELRAFVPVGHPAAQKAGISLQELCSQQLVLTECECSYRQLFEDTARQQGCVTTPLIQVSGDEAAFAAAENGLGIAILPRSMAVNSSRVIVKRLLGVRLFLSIGIVTRRDAIMPPCAEQFIQLLRTELKRPTTTNVIAV